MESGRHTGPWYWLPDEIFGLLRDTYRELVVADLVNAVIVAAPLAVARGCIPHMQPIVDRLMLYPKNCSPSFPVPTDGFVRCIAAFCSAVWSNGMLVAAPMYVDEIWRVLAGRNHWSDYAESDWCRLLYAVYRALSRWLGEPALTIDFCASLRSAEHN